MLQLAQSTLNEYRSHAGGSLQSSSEQWARLSPELRSAIEEILIESSGISADQRASVQTAVSKHAHIFVPFPIAGDAEAMSASEKREATSEPDEWHCLGAQVYLPGELWGKTGGSAACYVKRYLGTRGFADGGALTQRMQSRLQLTRVRSCSPCALI